MSTIIYKPLEATDIPVLMEIYNHFVMNSTASFHTEPVEITEFTESVIHPNPRFQTFVITWDGELQGYVQVMPHKKASLCHHRRSNDLFTTWARRQRNRFCRHSIY